MPGYGDDLEPAFRENGRDDRHEAPRLKEILATQVVGEGEVKRPVLVASGATLTF